MVFADLPLHGGHVPVWLAERMTRRGAAITECVLQRYGAPPRSLGGRSVVDDQAGRKQLSLFPDA